MGSSSYRSKTIFVSSVCPFVSSVCSFGSNYENRIMALVRAIKCSVNKGYKG